MSDIQVIDAVSDTLLPSPDSLPLMVASSHIGDLSAFEAAVSEQFAKVVEPTLPDGKYRVKSGFVELSYKGEWVKIQELAGMRKGCMDIITLTKKGKPEIVYQVPNEFATTKKNRTYLIPGDRTSPQGIILKGDLSCLLPMGDRDEQLAMARYDAREVLAWMSTLDD